jgi:hypothetical protein
MCLPEAGEKLAMGATNIEENCLLVCLNKHIAVARELESMSGHIFKQYVNRAQALKVI